jgi:hypothetical protein
LAEAGINAESENHAQISNLINEIKPPRKGVSESEVARVKSPFLMLYKVKNSKGKTAYAVENKSVDIRPLTLESSINKVVKINGKWYKEGDRVRQYTIVEVSPEEVLLKSNKKELKLYLYHKNEKIQFKVN